MQDIVCPPELMLAQMTNAGVDHCVLQAGGGYGAMNDYNAFAQRQYPAKFTGLLHVDEATADLEATLAEVDRAAGVLGLRGLYYAQDFSRHGYARNVDHDAFRPFWDRIVGAQAAGVHRAVVDPDLRSRRLSRQPARARSRFSHAIRRIRSCS